jgi:hypothetical protein
MPGEPAHEILRRFAAHAEDLSTLRLVRTGELRASFSINAPGIGQPVQMSEHRPDEEDLRSFLMSFRHFVMERSPIFVNYVLNVAHQHITDDELAHLAAAARRRWLESQRQGTVEFVVNDDRITPAHITDLWINGYYFHMDETKRRQLEAIARTGLSRWMFMNAIVNASRVVLHLGRLCTAAVREGFVSEAKIR